VRIVIDYRPALRDRTGVGEHIHQVARELTQTGSDEITVFSSSWKDRLAPSLAIDLPKARLVDRRIPVSALNFAWHRLGWPPVEAMTGGEFDIAHSPHPLLLPSRDAAQVITIHDLHFLAHPERTSAEIRRDYPELVRSHAQKADGIIVVSRFVAGQVQERLDIPPGRISVCANGAPQWKTPPALPSSDGYLLFVGTIEPRKNVGGLLEAFGRVLARRPHAPQLVVAGRTEPDSAHLVETMQRPPLAGHVQYRGYVAPNDREKLFKGAQMLLLPSFDEGFGIPALEAMAAGVPVVASDRGALPEVVGDAGLLVTPDDPESIASAITRLLEDRSLREVCSRRGLDRARQFTWSQTARDTRRAYEDALRTRRARTRATAEPEAKIQARDAHRR